MEVEATMPSWLGHSASAPTGLLGGRLSHKPCVHAGSAKALTGSAAKITSMTDVIAAFASDLQGEPVSAQNPYPWRAR